MLRNAALQIELGIFDWDAFFLGAWCMIWVWLLFNMMFCSIKYVSKTLETNAEFVRRVDDACKEYRATQDDRVREGHY